MIVVLFDRLNGMDCTESEEFFTAKLEYGRIYCFEIDIETLEFHIETVTHTHRHNLDVSREAFQTCISNMSIGYSPYTYCLLKINNIAKRSKSIAMFVFTRAYTLWTPRPNNSPTLLVVHIHVH